jgi:hypothetical protein
MYTAEHTNMLEYAIDDAREAPAIPIVGISIRLSKRFKQNAIPDDTTVISGIPVPAR